jgi:hypothetical protein
MFNSVVCCELDALEAKYFHIFIGRQMLSIIVRAEFDLSVRFLSALAA